MRKREVKKVSKPTLSVFKVYHRIIGYKLTQNLADWTPMQKYNQLKLPQMSNFNAVLIK